MRGSGGIKPSLAVAEKEKIANIIFTLDSLGVGEKVQIERFIAADHRFEGKVLGDSKAVLLLRCVS